MINKNYFYFLPMKITTLEEYVKENKKQNSKFLKLFCKKLGVSRQTYYNVLSQKSKPSYDLMKKIYIITGGKVKYSDWFLSTDKQ